jgi:NAD(P)H-dependent flavin oxidoreductase YrpB (nitropropane dioxygenase family)
MGTRFMATQESPVHEKQKNITIEKTPFDTVYTDRVDGMLARMMDAKGSRKLINKMLNPFSALIRSTQITKLLGLPWVKLFFYILLSGPKKSIAMARMAIGFKAFEVGTMDGDNAKGVLPLGQITGIIKDTPTVKEVINSIMKEAKAVHKKMDKII